MTILDPGWVKTPEAPKPSEWLSEIAQNRLRSEIVISPIVDPRRDFFYQFSPSPRLYTAKTQSGLFVKCSERDRYHRYRRSRLALVDEMTGWRS
jgi:hypothetical protein